MKQVSGVLVPLLFVVFAMTLVACSGNGEADTSDKKIAGGSSEIERPAFEGEDKLGWEKATFERYLFSIPKSWKKDMDLGIWCPGDQNLNMGRPNVSLHCGGMPVMPGSKVESRLEFYYGVVPTTLEEIEKCGMKGMFVEATSRGRKHLGLILVEEIGAMKIINFFDCQAPVDDFDSRLETFEKILKSVACQ